MTTDKKQEQQQEKPIELEDREIEQVAGGRKRPDSSDPCEGGEVTKKY